MDQLGFCLLAMKQKVIDQFPVNQAKGASVDKEHISATKIIHSQNFVPKSKPSKGNNSRRGLDLLE